MSRKSIGSTRSPESEKAILDAAYELLLEKGVGGFSMEGVAKRAQAGKPTIYRWWPSKANLLMAVYNRLKADLDDPVGSDLSQFCQSFIKNVLEFWETNNNGVVFRSIISESQGDRVAQEALSKYHEARSEYLADLIISKKFKHNLDLDSARLLADTLGSIILSRLVLNRISMSAIEIKALCDSLIKGY